MKILTDNGLVLLWQKIKDLYKKISVSAKQTTTSTADGGTNVMTFTFGDGSSTTLSVKNGSKGSDGARGATGATGATGAKGEKGDRGPVGETGPQGNSGIADASNKALINDAITGGETSYLSAEVGKLGILTYDCSKGGTIEHASLQDAINAVPTTFRKAGVSIIYKSEDSIYRYALKSSSWSTDTANWFSVDDTASILYDGVPFKDIDFNATKGFYINFINKEKATSEELSISSPIKLSKGQLLYARIATIYNFVAAITLCTSDGSVMEPVVCGRTGGVGSYVYLATEDCYVMLSYHSGKQHYVQIAEGQFLKQISQSINDSYINSIILRNKSLGSTPSYTLEKDKYINYVNHEKLPTSSYLAVSTPIKVQKGQILMGRFSTIYDFVAAVSLTDKNGSFYEPILKGTNEYNDYVYIVEKDSYIAVCYAYNYCVELKIIDSNFPLGNSDNSVTNLNMGVAGDSITEGNQWSYYAALKLNSTHYNVGVGGACWSYKDMYASDGKTLLKPQHYGDTNFAGFSGSNGTDTEKQMFVNNNACIHVEKFLASVENGTFPTPDVFIFAYGTNEDESRGNYNGSVEAAMNAISISDEDFVDEKGKSLKYTMCGAMRWCVETIKRSYPSCKVFISIPIQRAKFTVNNDYLYPKVKLIKDMAIQMGCQIIDQYNGCGITSSIENDTAPFGPFLRDGLHPNTEGQKLMGNFAAKEIQKNFF